MASSSAQTHKRTSSKKSRTEVEPRTSLEELELLQLRERNARKRIKPSHSLDVNYWLSAAEVTDIKRQIYDVETKRAIKKWKEDEGKPAAQF